MPPKPPKRAGRSVVTEAVGVGVGDGTVGGVAVGVDAPNAGRVDTEGRAAVVSTTARGAAVASSLTGIG